MNYLSTNDILDRVKNAKKLNNDSKLAEYLSVKKNTISSWRSRNAIDLDLIIAKCNNINLHWLLTGEGNMLRNVEQDSICIEHNFAGGDIVAGRVVNNHVETAVPDTKGLKKENAILRQQIETQKREIASLTLSLQDKDKLLQANFKILKGTK